MVTQDGTRPIHVACLHGQLEMVRALIKMGSSAATCTENELCWQPIHFACGHGHKELLCELVDNHGMDPNVGDGVSCFSGIY
jgi:ankyrin repeat protein